MWNAIDNYKELDKNFFEEKYTNLLLKIEIDEKLLKNDVYYIKILSTKDSFKNSNYSYEFINKVPIIKLENIKNDLIITAGQDRRVGIYNFDEKKSYYKEASFLIYSVGLSPSGKLGGFASDEENNVTIFNTNTKENLYKLTQNKSTLTNILFFNENEIFVTSDDKKINYYKLN